MQEKCENCRYFHVEAIGQDTCRRFPRQWLPDSIDYARSCQFSEAYSEEWCGEWQARDTPLLHLTEPIDELGE